MKRFQCLSRYRIVYEAYDFFFWIENEPFKILFSELPSFSLATNAKVTLVSVDKSIPLFDTTSHDYIQN